MPDSYLLIYLIVVILVAAAALIVQKIIMDYKDKKIAQLEYQLDEVDERLRILGNVHRITNC